MISVDGVLNDVLRREGGYVDDPSDPGGATNLGISLRYARGIGLDLDNDGDTDADDIQQVDPSTAKSLYRRDFWLVPRIDRLPEAVQPQMVDFAINSGPGRAIIELQKILEYARRTAQDEFTFAAIIPDGVIGPKTAAACTTICNTVTPDLLNEAIVDARVDYLNWLVEADPVRQKYINGWIARAEEFRP